MPLPLPPIGSTVYEQGYDGDNFEMTVLKHHLEDNSITVVDHSLNDEIKRINYWTTEPLPGFGA